MIDKLYELYERNIKYILVVVPLALLIVMAYLYIKAD